MLTWKDIMHFVRQGSPAPERVVRKTEEEWRSVLSAEEFMVTRKHGTERAFSGEYCTAFDPGTYACRCCGNILFDGQSKFESGTGWPSFTQPADPSAIRYHQDTSYGMIRVETLCNVCDAHLGHVFPDGPSPSGLRYCMNSVALRKIT